MAYPQAAWERAMTVQEVMLKALSGELHWFRAAEILGWSPRTLRRWRERFETHGHSGLIDRRLLRPSKRRVPPAQVELVLRCIASVMPDSMCGTFTRSRAASTASRSPTVL